MKITLTNTSRIVQVNGVPARVWEGETEKGVKVYALITRIAAHTEGDNSDFERELLEQPAPPSDDAVRAFPPRMTT